MASNDHAVSQSAIKAHLVGSGIASLAAAAFLIRDAGVPGGNITIYEEGKIFGGSLDGAGTPSEGYVIRGGRMFTYEAYTCTFDLLASVPSLDDPTRTVKDEIYAFNEKHVSHSRARLVSHGQKVDVSRMGFCNRDRFDLMKILAVTEASLGAKRIEDVFASSFFTTNFWYMWATTFAFQPWHSAVEMKRYLHRFLQEFPRINTLAGVRRTPYNQYDSIVRPLTKWLIERGVHFETGVRVTDMDFKYGPHGKAVERIHYRHEGLVHEIGVSDDDLVFITNGSMTAASSLGSMTSPAQTTSLTELPEIEAEGAWALWETLAKRHPDFGHPEAFTRNQDESKWLSFTTTLHDPTFYKLMEDFTGNTAGTGGLVTFIDSNWLMSVVLAYQPHFLGQPDDVNVFWGYGLFTDQEGNFVKKKMSHCSGEEIMTELLGHLRFDREREQILKSANCIPCMMPFITSQFMPRVAGDRPPVTPNGTHNLAFLGQYCEMPDDVVFTVEYSVRSAQTAVYALLGVDRPIPPIYKGQYDPAVLAASFKNLLQ